LRVSELEQRPRIRAVIPEARPLMSLLDDVLATGASLDRYLEDVARAHVAKPSELVSTDDNLYLEYATPRGNVLPWSTREELVSELLGYRDRADWARLSAP
jgi:spermidine synthase